MLNKSNCLICSEELEYYDELREMTCVFCQQTYDSNVNCRNNHFICDHCHSKDAKEIIKKAVHADRGIDPLNLANDIMKHPSIKMHGPEHHFLVPAVLLSAYYNATDKKELLPDKLERAEKRSSRAWKTTMTTPRRLCAAWSSRPPNTPAPKIARARRILGPATSSANRACSRNWLRPRRNTTSTPRCIASIRSTS